MRWLFLVAATVLAISLADEGHCPTVILIVPPTSLNLPIKLHIGRDDNNAHGQPWLTIWPMADGPKLTAHEELFCRTPERLERGSGTSSSSTVEVLCGWPLWVQLAYDNGDRCTYPNHHDRAHVLAVVNDSDKSMHVALTAEINKPYAVYRTRADWLMAMRVAEENTYKNRYDFHQAPIEDTHDTHDAHGASDYTLKIEADFRKFAESAAEQVVESIVRRWKMAANAAGECTKLCCDPPVDDERHIRICRDICETRPAECKPTDMTRDPAFTVDKWLVGVQNAFNRQHATMDEWLKVLKEVQEEQLG